MPNVRGPIQVAAAGTTGNNTHTVGLSPQETQVAVDIVVEAAGATPTATFTVQGSADGTNFYPLSLLQADASVATSNAAIVLTAAGDTLRYVDGLDKRFLRNLRVVVSANTNITYHINAHVRSNN